MSREIKFRCWSNEEGQYFPMQTVNFVDNKPISVGYHKKGHKGFLHMRSPRFVLEQYIGLTDKNFKEIYEGDVVKTNSPDQPNFKVGVIEFVQQAFWISNVPSNRPDHTHSELLLQYWETEIEVIGNIHENPELLGDKE